MPIGLYRGVGKEGSEGSEQILYIPLWSVREEIGAKTTFLKNNIWNDHPLKNSFLRPCYMASMGLASSVPWESSRPYGSYNYTSVIYPKKVRYRP